MSYIRYSRYPPGPKRGETSRCNERACPTIYIYGAKCIIAAVRRACKVQSASLGASLTLAYTAHTLHVDIPRGGRKLRAAKGGRRGRGCMSGGQANGPPRLSGFSVIQSLQRNSSAFLSSSSLSLPAFLSRLVAHMSHRTVTFIRKTEFAETIVIDFCYFLPKNAKNEQRNSALEGSHNNIMLLL